MKQIIDSENIMCWDDPNNLTFSVTLSWKYLRFDNVTVDNSKKYFTLDSINNYHLYKEISEKLCVLTSHIIDCKIGRNIKYTHKWHD